VSRDGVFGPVLRFGLGVGGVLRGEPVVSLPPLNTAIIETLVQTSGLATALSTGGAIETPDVAAIKRTLWAVSEIVSEVPEILELEVSGLVAYRGEMYASGASAAIARPQPGTGRYDHMAIHPYPSAIGVRWELPGGAIATVRPIRPEDAEMEARFVRNLSDNARYFRFMVGLKELPREMLIRFTQIDYDRELALVAVNHVEGQPEFVGVARYICNPDQESAEFAIVVGDDWQKRGVARGLMLRLIDAARTCGIARFEGTVLRANHNMLRFTEALGFKTRDDPEDPEQVIVERPL
jgi:acetyltransferase